MSNKQRRLGSWFHSAGIKDMILQPALRYEKKLPTIDTSQQIRGILSAADSSLRVALNLALKCGLRDQEVIYLEWLDIDENDRVLCVCSKGEYCFKVEVGEQVIELAVNSVGSTSVHTNAFAGGQLLATHHDTDTYFALNDWPAPVASRSLPTPWNMNRCGLFIP